MGCCAARRQARRENWDSLNRAGVENVRQICAAAWKKQSVPKAQKRGTDFEAKYRDRFGDQNLVTDSRVAKYRP